ncbi:unnamed protein product, partial [Litomosoides sigmodontis]
GELASILTQFDRDIDEASVHKGKQMIDKLTGALYLGELARRILVQFTLDGYLFNGKCCEKLDEVDSFPTKYISEILRDEEGSFKICRRICDELDAPSHCTADYEIIHEMSACDQAIAALLRHIGRNSIKIGWELVPADEGSAKGAAIVAAVAEKLAL